MTDRPNLAERVAQKAHELENIDNPEDVGTVIDVRVEASLNGTAREFIVVTNPSQPRIEINVTKGAVTGWLDGERHTTPLFENEDVLHKLDRLYSAKWRVSDTDA